MGDQGLTLAAQSLRDLVTEQQLRDNELAAAAAAGDGRPAKSARTACGAARSTARHVETEQRRRDRINEGFTALKALMPNQEKMDKASFLMGAVEYISQLQGVMVKLLEMGAVSKLPEDVQWSVRVLLPRKEDPAVAAARAAAQAASGVAPNPNGSLLAPAALPAFGGAAALPQFGAQQLQQPAASLPLLPGQGVQARGQDMASLLQQALLMQQLQSAQQHQQQSAGPNLHALPLQQLLAGTQLDLSGNTITIQALGQAAQQVAGNAGCGVVGAPANQPGPNVAPGGSAGCCPAPEEDASAPAKARKGAKVRRHTTKAQFAVPPTLEEELGQATMGGRPLAP